MSRRHVVGVDVGTGSVRAAVFDVTGSKLSLATAAIGMTQPHTGHFEQSSAEIWRAVGVAVRAAVVASAVDAASVVGIGFDATCSMVVTGADDQRISVTQGGTSSGGDDDGASTFVTAAALLWPSGRVLLISDRPSLVRACVCVFVCVCMCVCGRVSRGGLGGWSVSGCCQQSCVSSSCLCRFEKRV